MNQTKIVATLGPASSDLKTIEQLIIEGASVFRLNFSHGSHAEQQQRAEIVRQAAENCNRQVAILADLQGPKIRIARFVDGFITLARGDSFTIDSSLDKNAGTQDSVGIDYPELIDDCKVGNILLLNDGLITIEVKAIEPNKLRCEVIDGGRLSNNKGINRQGGGFSAPALSDKDIADMEAIAGMDIDYVAVSFVREANDIIQTRKILAKHGCHAHIVAKIERAEAINDFEVLDSIINEADCIMVARGDLGVEVGNAELVGLQKHLIQRTRELNKTVITATQMMESMIDNPAPTRAEVMDVANAVLDGTDAVMLSAETAAGNYPVETVRAVTNILAGAEKHVNLLQRDLSQSADKIDASIANAAMFTANNMNQLSTIVSLSSTGNTPLLMSRHYCRRPIYAFSQEISTQRRMALYRNVHPLALEKNNYQLPFQIAINSLKSLQVVTTGDTLIITYGDITGAVGGTNNMKVITL